MWGSATRRKEKEEGKKKKERKEMRKGSRIFLFSKMVSFWKVGLAARMKERFFLRKRGTHWRKRFKRRRRKKHKKTSGDFLRIETSADFFIYLSEVSIPRIVGGDSFFGERTQREARIGWSGEILRIRGTNSKGIVWGKTRIGVLVGRGIKIAKKRKRIFSLEEYAERGSRRGPQWS